MRIQQAIQFDRMTGSISLRYERRPAEDLRRRCVRRKRPFGYRFRSAQILPTENHTSRRRADITSANTISPMAAIHATKEAGNHNVIRRDDSATMQGEHDLALAHDRTGE
jgi:hypothetical protein